MIWPVSDCPDPVELIVIPGYHQRRERGYVAVQALGYSARWSADEPGLISVRDAAGEDKKDWLELALNADVEANPGEGLGEPTSSWELSPENHERQVQRGDKATLVFVRNYTRGSLKGTVTFFPEYLTYSVTVCASHSFHLCRLSLAEGTRVSAQTVFDPQPASHGMFFHAPHRVVDHRSKWLSPPPFAVCFEREEKDWMIAAVECPVEDLGFSGFHGESTRNGQFRFVLEYPSKVPIEKEWQSPALVWRFGFADPYAALRGYAEGLASSPGRSAVDWWQGTMVCGWHRQVELATHAKHAAPSELQKNADAATGAPRSQSYATQEVYEEHVRTVEQAGVPFDILIIDHGWSVSEGVWSPDLKKWPDLKGFVDKRHAEGRKVLMWICAWSQGLPEEECLQFEDGGLQLDPENPQWKNRVQDQLRFLLSDAEGCMGADGLKFDFTGPMVHPGQLKNGKPKLHGYAYLHQLFTVISEAANAAKADCLLDFQCAHPQFAHLHGMTRLNDFFLPQLQAMRVMETRANIAKAAAFDRLIDTDCPAGLDYLSNSAKFGNPSLYLTHEQLADPGIVRSILCNQQALS